VAVGAAALLGKVLLPVEHPMASIFLISGGSETGATHKYYLHRGVAGHPAAAHLHE